MNDPMFMDKNVTPSNLSEIVVCNNKELTYKVFEDICVDKGIPMMHSVNVNTDSRSLEDNKLEEVVDTKDPRKVVNGEEANDNCENSSLRDIVTTSRSVYTETLTLGDIISMDDSQDPANKSNISETEPEKTEEPKANNSIYVSSEKSELKKPLLNNVVEDSYDHHNLIFSRSFSETDSGLAHITYSGHISVSGSLSVRSDGSTISAHSFAFPILQSEWNSSPIRMAKAEKRQRRKEKGWRHYSLLLCCRF